MHRQGRSPQVSSPYQRATVEGTLNSVNGNERLLNISRGPIEKWNRPAATLDFIADPSVDLTLVQAGQQVRFTFEIRDGDFVVIKLAPEQEEHSHD